MRHITIHTPIWNGGSPKIGLAEDKLTSNIIEVEIDYTNRWGDRLYPDPFYITKDAVLHYPTRFYKGHILHLVPIGDLK